MVNKWQDLADKWIFYIPPHRPSKRDLKCIRDQIRKNFNSVQKLSALVLGAIPELRDLLYEEDTFISVVDINPKVAVAGFEPATNGL